MIQDGSIGLGVKFEAVLATSIRVREITDVLSLPKKRFVYFSLIRHLRSGSDIASNATPCHCEGRRIPKGVGYEEPAAFHEYSEPIYGSIGLSQPRSTFINDIKKARELRNHD